MKAYNTRGVAPHAVQRGPSLKAIRSAYAGRPSVISRHVPSGRGGFSNCTTGAVGRIGG